jgi:2-polyprenyl-3-methyl-5-hydroxy-6-metoxy-1,4-benzoquinol methylase
MTQDAVSMDVDNSVNAAKEAERQWHDAFYKAHAGGDFPATLAEFRERFQRVELTTFCEGGWNWWADPRREALDGIGDVRGLRVLDYGCGSGRLAIYLSSCGAQVWGFDLSGEATSVASGAARQYGLSAQFEQMDAENLAYPDDFFDLVVSFGVLHHVIKYPNAASHLVRVMKPGTKAVFVETLWDNPIINLVRRFTITDAEAGDAHLTQQNIREFGREFRQVRLEKRHLVYMLKRLAKLPEGDLKRAMRPRPLWKFVKSVDEQLLRFQPLRRFCGEVIIYLQK